MTFSLPTATTITPPPPLYSIFLYSSVTFISRTNSSPSRHLCCSPMSILCTLDLHSHETSIPWIPELSAQPNSPFYRSQTFYPSYLPSPLPFILPSFQWLQPISHVLYVQCPQMFQASVFTCPWFPNDRSESEGTTRWSPSLWGMKANILRCLTYMVHVKVQINRDANFVHPAWYFSFELPFSKELRDYIAL